MADAVLVTTLMQGQDKMVLQMTSVSDGTGEANVTKLSLASILNQSGTAATRCGILEAQYSISGFSSVRLAWDHTTDDRALVMATGNGYRDFRDSTPWMDPQSTGGNGDLLLTSASPAVGAAYDITLVLALRFG